MNSLAKKLALPILAVGLFASKAAIDCRYKSLEQKMQEASMAQETVKVPMEYNKVRMKVHLQGNMIFERYEVSLGKDRDYCIQLVEYQGLILDGINNAKCDERIDAYSHKRGVEICEEGSIKCKDITDLFETISIFNNLPAIKQTWRKIRESCDKPTCYSILDIPMYRMKP